MTASPPHLAEVARLLAAATDIIDGQTSLPPRRRTRAAALLARSALEHLIDTRLTAAGHDLSEANQRSKLICLRTLVDPERGPAIEAAYATLSQACHHHAYELSPVGHEIRPLLAVVEQEAVHVLTALTAPGP